MKPLLLLEELAMFLLAAAALYVFNAAWWIYLLLLVGPDVGMIGYVINERIGAITYNLFHHKGVAVLIFLAGVFIDSSVAMLAGTVLFGHSSMDRLFGYGMKYFTGFHHTHLGIIGNQQQQPTQA